MFSFTLIKNLFIMYHPSRLCKYPTVTVLRWPKRVNHKSVYQNTNHFPKTQINFPKRKLVFQTTNQFPKTQISFPKHKLVCQNTNQFGKTQINFSKHKPSPRNTNQKTWHLLCNYQREPGRDSFPGFSASNMATSISSFRRNVLSQLWIWIFVLLSMWNKVRRCCAIFSITVVFRKCNGKGGNRGLH